MTTSLLSLRQFGIGFRERMVLRSVDLEIPARGATVLVGPVAVGKSTLLRALAGAFRVRPETRIWGAADYRGRPLLETPPHELPALVGQKAKFLTASVVENLVGLRPDRSKLTLSDQRSIAADMVCEAGLPMLADKLDQPVVELPIGWQRRLAIVRTTAARPALLCVDEPTAELAPDEADAILDLLARYAEQAAVMMVTHNQPHAQRLGGWTSLLVGGRVLEHRPTAQFFSDPQTPAGRQFVRTGGCGAHHEEAGESSESSAPAEGSVAEATGGDVEPPASETVGGGLDAPSATHPPTPSSASRTTNSGASKQPRAPKSAPIVPKGRPLSGLGPRGFVWLWPGELGGVPRPGLLRDVDYDLALLANLGVNTLVCLTDEAPPIDDATLHRHGLIGLWSPMPDMGAPDLDQGWRLCRRLSEWLHEGRSIAVHCRAGLGRTGTVLAAQLIYSEGQSALAALETVRRSEPKWVQSSVQVEFLVQFASFVEQRRREEGGNASTNYTSPSGPASA